MNFRKRIRKYTLGLLTVAASILLMQDCERIYLAKGCNTLRSAAISGGFSYCTKGAG